MIAARFSRTSSIAKPDFHIHGAISTCMRRRRATHTTAPSHASTSPPAASPSNRSSGTSSRNTASNPAAPTGATSSGATKPASATPSAPNPGPTPHPSHRPIPRRGASRSARLPPRSVRGEPPRSPSEGRVEPKRPRTQLTQQVHRAPSRRPPFVVSRAGVPTGPCRTTLSSAPKPPSQSPAPSPAGCRSSPAPRPEAEPVLSLPKDSAVPGRAR